MRKILQGCAFGQLLIGDAIAWVKPDVALALIVLGGVFWYIQEGLE